MIGQPTKHCTICNVDGHDASGHAPYVVGENPELDAELARQMQGVDWTVTATGGLKLTVGEE